MSKQKRETLPVIFRADKRLEYGQRCITAVFPTCIGTYDPGTFTIYQHIGQYGTGTRTWYNRTRPATRAEYASLLKELRGIYGRDGGLHDPAYTLKVVQRMTRAHDDVRQEDARRHTELLRQLKVVKDELRLARKNLRALAQQGGPRDPFDQMPPIRGLDK